MKIDFVYGDADWSGMYIDGKLVYENHTMDYETVLEVLGIEYTDTYIDINGQLPEKFEDVKIVE